MLKEQKADYDCKVKTLNETIKVLLKEKANRTKQAAQTHDVSEGERDALRQQSKLIYSFAPFVVTLSNETLLLSVLESKTNAAISTTQLSFMKTMMEDKKK